MYSRTQSHSGAGATETVPIDKQPAYVLGRQPDVVDVALAEPSTSRQHAALVHHQDGRLFLIDLGSVRCLLASPVPWLHHLRQGIAAA